MAQWKKRIGVRAHCSVLLKWLHQQNFISQYYPNYSKNKWLDDVVTVQQSSITHGGNEFVCIFMVHPSFQQSDAIYIAKQYHTVNQDGNPDGFFDNASAQDEVAIDNDKNFLSKIDPQVFSSSNQAQDYCIDL